MGDSEIYVKRKKIEFSENDYDMMWNLGFTS